MIPQKVLYPAKQLSQRSGIGALGGELLLDIAGAGGSRVQSKDTEGAGKLVGSGGGPRPLFLAKLPRVRRRDCRLQNRHALGAQASGLYPDFA